MARHTNVEIDTARVEVRIITGQIFPMNTDEILGIGLSYAPRAIRFLIVTK